MQWALEAAGIEFINGGKPGVRINPIKARRYSAAITAPEWRRQKTLSQLSIIGERR
jgi:hypothetical protein